MTVGVRSKIVAMIVAATLLEPLAGCANRESRRADPATARTSMADTRADTRRAESSATLSDLAAAERSRPAQRTPAPLPPGIEPAALAPRAMDDPKAFESLEALLARFVSPTPSSKPQAPEIAPDDRVEALKAYAKGRNAALDGRHLQAMTEFQKALALDASSASVLREMARSYDAMGNPGRAMELLEQLVEIDGTDPEALLALGLAAANRRDFEVAIGHLARLRSLPDAAPESSASAILAAFTLAMSLRETGYDRAMIEVAQEVVNVSPQLAAGAQSTRLASVYRQRGDIWRSIGDAHARLGEFPAALDAWSVSSTLPSADATALLPRVMYAHLRLGRPYSSQLALLHSLRAAAETGMFSERDVQLCAFAARATATTDRLAADVLDLHRAHPEEGGLLRAAAMLLPPDRAISLLRETIAQRPDDLKAVAQLLDWLRQQDVDSAAALTVSLVEDHPSRSDDFADAFAAAMPAGGAAIRSIAAQPGSPAQSAVLSRLYLRAGALGQAWSSCEAGLQQAPSDRGLLLLRVHAAVAMREPSLVERAIAAVGEIDDAKALVALAQARRSLGQTQAAVDLAQRAVESDPQNAASYVELALAQHAHAAMLNEADNATAARVAVDAAIAAANRAIELTPDADEGYGVLALIYGHGGALADSNLLRDALLRLRQANPQSALYARLAAQDSINQRRYTEAIERLLGAYEADSSDDAALTLAVTAWDRAGQLDAAETWLRERLAARPGDASLREQLVRVLLRKEQADKAIAELGRQIDADPDDWAARRLLENVYRVAGQADSALHVGEPRLLAQPEGVRRELDLANLYAAAELAEPALDRLERVAALADEAALDDLANALAIAGGVGSSEGDRRERVTRRLALVTLERFPEAPLQVYGSAARAMAREGPLDDEFDALVRDAVARSRGADDTSFRGARLWQELAQALVQDGLPAAAARVLRVRLAEAPHFETPAHAALARIVLVLDAETAQQADANDQRLAVEAANATIALVRDLHERGLLQRVFDTSQELEIAGGLYEASVLYTLVGASTGSEIVMRKALAADPDEPMTLNNLGYLLLERGAHDEEVVQMIERSHAQRPQEHNILDTIGWLRYKQGRFADNGGAPGAASLIQSSIESNEDPSAEVFDHLGDVKWRMGDRGAAMEAWRRAVALLEDGAFRERITQSIAALQARQWGIIVMDSSRLYDREYAPVLDRARKKLEAVERGERPLVAPIWSEQQAPAAGNTPFAASQPS